MGGKKKPGPTKPKTRRVPSDDLIIEVDGEQYAIHEGEWVEFRGRPSMGFFAMVTKFESLRATRGDEGVTPEFIREYAAIAETLAEEMARRISAWSWTDDAGDPMPVPAEGAALDALEPIEFTWLLRALLDPSGGDRPNASSPSTSA